ncbi:MAG: hypothetical protein GF392_05460 [Candidatus Omnitrophica bacterium]|nr:hypothetical protein [Candidatus Omnitrophota bacterium]
MKNGVLRYTLIIGLAALVVLGGAFYYFYPKVVFPVVERYTGARISWSSCRGWPFRKVSAEEVKIVSEAYGAVLYAEKAEFRIDLKNMLRDRGLEAECDFSGVTLTATDGEKLSSEASDIMDIILDPERKYRTVSLDLFISTSLFEVSDFQAVSEDIRVDGQCRFDRLRDNLDLDVAIMFSPELVAGLPDTLRGDVVTLQEDGWYGTVIEFKGNPLLLSAIYSMTSDADGG